MNEIPTPRTDEAYCFVDDKDQIPETYVEVEFARQLERELHQANKKIKALEEERNKFQLCYTGLVDELEELVGKELPTRHGQSIALYNLGEMLKALEEAGQMLDWLESEEGKRNFYLSDNESLYDGKEIRQAIRNAMEKGKQ